MWLSRHPITKVGSRADVLAELICDINHIFNISIIFNHQFRINSLNTDVLFISSHAFMEQTLHKRFIEWTQ